MQGNAAQAVGRRPQGSLPNGQIAVAASGHGAKDGGWLG